VDPHDPEAPEVALLRPPVARGERHGALDLLLRDPVELRFREIVAFRPAKDLLPLQAPLVASFDARHRSLLLTGITPTKGRRRRCRSAGASKGIESALVWKHRLDALLVGLRDHRRHVEAALPLGRLLRQDVALESLRSLDLAGRGLLE